jgi:hypothetical protein
VATTFEILQQQSTSDLQKVHDQLETLQGLWNSWGPESFMAYFIWIQTKKPSRFSEKRKQFSRLIPFQYNPIQRDIELKRGNRNIILKARQVGMTTWVLLRRLLIPAILNPGTNSFLISQSTAKATEHFRMIQRARNFFAVSDPADASKNEWHFELIENLLHTRVSNRKELIFDYIDSSCMIGSAEVEESGQGSTLHHIACSEIARWPGIPEETLANVKEALVLDGTLDLESTANNAGGYFYEECMRAERGESEFTWHFHPWWWEPGFAIDLTEKQQQELQADLTREEELLREKFTLTLQQIQFRRTKQRSLRHNFPEKYPEDALSCFLAMGLNFFDVQIISLRLLELFGIKPVHTFGNGECRIFKKVMPHKSYIIGADPASGKTIAGAGDMAVTDFSAAKVIDAETGEEVAAYKARCSTVDFALDLERIGKYYNMAWIAVERGLGPEAAEGGTVILTLVNSSYPKIYKHKEWWRRYRKQKEEILLEGFPTNNRTRPIALNRLKQFIEETPALIHDEDLLKECRVFVRNEKGRPGAQPGAHDDAVLAAAIAQCVRLILLGYIDPLTMQREQYGQSDEEDEE